MDLLQGMEIYIPPEAEVKSVPLHSLSSSMRRKMGLSAGLETLPDSPVCIWICPALFQRKGQKEEPDARAGARQQVLSMLGSSRAAYPSLTKGYGQCRMTFVTAHFTAYRVLKETLPLGPNTQLCSSPMLPQGAPSQTEQDAVIIHRGRVYLSVKKPKQASVQHVSAAAPDTGDVTPVIHKRKRDTQYETLEQSQHRTPSCEPRRASLSQGASLGAGQNQGPSRDQEPPEESSEPGPSLAPHSAQQSHTESWGPSELLARHSLGPLKLNIDFQELASRERIALMKAKLQQRAPTSSDL